MTSPKLLSAARNARYLLTVYGQFGKVMPIVCAEMVMRELTEALEECDAEGEAEIRMERRVNRCLRRGQTELVKDGKGRGWKHKIDLTEWAGQ